LIGIRGKRDGRESGQARSPQKGTASSVSHML
jgi:hypothetical protein